MCRRWANKEGMGRREKLTIKDSCTKEIKILKQLIRKC
jgi:hypothetical protein